MNYLTLRVLSSLLFGIILLVGCSREPTEEELLRSATLHHSNDELDEALSDFRLFVEKHPRSDRVPEALFAMGSIYLNGKKDYLRAESVYTKLTMEFPAHPTAQGAAYERARIFVEHLHKPDSAIVAYEFFLQRYPDAIPASSARSELLELRKKTSSGK